MSDIRIKMAKDLRDMSDMVSDLHWMAAKAVEDLTKKEGEIAKRDETIARLEPQLNRAIQANYDLREELAACRVAVENCDLFRARIAELEARIVWLECEAQVNAVPVSDAKAQGVVMQSTDGGRNPRYEGLFDGETEEQRASRLNATPVQQVSVPDGWKLVPVEPTPEMVCAAEEAHMPFGDMDIALRMAILSAPSAPATVQGVNQQLLEALEELMYAHTDKAEALATAAIAAARKGEGK